MDLSQASEHYYALLNDERPSSLRECEGRDRKVDPELYRQYKEKESDIEEAERNYFFAMGSQEEQEDTTASSVQKSRSSKSTTNKRRKKSCQSLRPYYFDNDGKLKYLLPTETVWYFAYVRHENPIPPQSKLAVKFRRRFRMPYSTYLDLLQQVQAAQEFSRWQGCSAVGVKASPVGLLLLGALRYLGRGLTFDDLEEYTAIGEETHRQFFHIFIRYGEDTLYPQYVFHPKTAEEYTTHRAEFDTGGLTGAGFSCDATNVIMWRCEHNLKQANMGFKNTHPARTYNVCFNHRRELLHSTKGHPSRWNDKSLAIFDEFLSGIHEDKILQDVKFDLLEWRESNGEKTIARRPYAGAWGLVDNGYHRWACTQAPSKINNLLIEQQFSDWIESFRKDSECFFGILKGRWRVLKTGIRLEGAEAADAIWLTCCALHNMLLRVDGLAEQWEDGVASNWEGDLGNNDPEECRLHAPFAIQRPNNPQLAGFGSREHEAEAAMIGDPEDCIDLQDDVTRERRTATGATYVNSLSYRDFRDRLIIHFDILHRKNKIRWPTRKPPALAQQVLED